MQISKNRKTCNAQIIINIIFVFDLIFCFGKVRFIAYLKRIVIMSEETGKIGLECLVKRRKNFFRTNTMMIKIWQNEKLHPFLVEYFTQYQGQSQVTRATSN